MTIGYVMSRFPKLTETFVLDEMLEMEAQGETVSIYPLWRESTKVIHDRAVALVERANFLPTLSIRILSDNFRWLIKHPALYLSTATVSLWSNKGSLRFLLGAIAIFPKVVSMASHMETAGVKHVHAHFASHPALAAFIIGRLTGIPWSFTAHGSDLHRCQVMLGEKLSNAKFSVAISEYNKNFMISATEPRHAERIQVVHCGVHVEQFPNIHEHGQLANNNQKLNIGCIGTLHEVKGQAYLLRACAALDQANWECHLIGDGPDRKALEKLAIDLGIAAKVVFHGQLKQDQVRNVLQELSIVCAPSVPTRDGRREGIPVALIEAAACAIPIIASRLSGIPELIVDKQTGLLVEPKNIPDLTAALNYLSSSPTLRMTLGENARSKVKRDYSLKNGVERLRNLMHAREASEEKP